MFNLYVACAIVRGSWQSTTAAVADWWDQQTVAAELSLSMTACGLVLLITLAIGRGESAQWAMHKNQLNTRKYAPKFPRTVFVNQNLGTVSDQTVQKDRDSAYDSDNFWSLNATCIYLH